MKNIQKLYVAFRKNEYFVNIPFAANALPTEKQRTQLILNLIFIHNNMVKISGYEFKHFKMVWDLIQNCRRKYHIEVQQYRMVSRLFEIKYYQGIIAIYSMFSEMKY